MKYDRRAIMKAAWHKHNRFGIHMSAALRMAWYDARKAAARFNVYGVRFDGSRELLASGVDFDRAGEIEWMSKYRFERIEQKAA